MTIRLKQIQGALIQNGYKHMITVFGKHYINGTRIPYEPVVEMVKDYKAKEARVLDDDLPDFESDYVLNEKIQEYAKTYGVILNENAIENLIKEVQV